MVWFGGLVVLLAIVAIFRKFEIKIILLLAGLLMAVAARKPLTFFDAFSAALVNDGLVPVICTTVGFFYVMKLTGCFDHYSRGATKMVRRGGMFLIPLTVLVTFALNIALPSAAACAVVVGSLVIPVLINSGIRPVVAAGAVLAGTWGSILGGGNIHTPIIAKLAGVSVDEVIAGHALAALTGVAVLAVTLTAVAVLWKEDSGEAPPEEQEIGENKINVIMALMPLVPLILLLAGSLAANLPGLSVPTVMLVGTILGLIFIRCKPGEVTTDFFRGMGEAFAGIIGIVVAVTVFNKGMEVIGVTGTLIDLLKHSEQYARLAVGAGPFVVALLTGSGDTATMAFNAVITPNAKEFGFTVSQMGSMAYIAGALGRSASPFAAATIICAHLAGVNVVDVVKRNAPGVVLALVAVALLLLRSSQGV